MKMYEKICVCSSLKCVLSLWNNAADILCTCIPHANEKPIDLDRSIGILTTLAA